VRFLRPPSEPHKDLEVLIITQITQNCGPLLRWLTWTSSLPVKSQSGSSLSGVEAYSRGPKYSGAYSQALEHTWSAHKWASADPRPTPLLTLI
jgi:hypothetical protein